MSRQTRWRWLATHGRCTRNWLAASVDPLCRRLRLEPLEDRRLLASVTVVNLNDIVNGDVTSIAALRGNPGGDGISLREAVLAANADSTADVIDFGAAVKGAIQLTNVGHAGEIAITNDLTIQGPGGNLLTIRAFDPSAAVGDGSRIFKVDDGTGTVRTVSISGLTLTGGDPTTNGGAISTREDLTVSGSTIRGRGMLTPCASL